MGSAQEHESILRLDEESQANLITFTDEILDAEEALRVHRESESHKEQTDEVCLTCSEFEEYLSQLRDAQSETIEQGLRLQALED